MKHRMRMANSFDPAQTNGLDAASRGLLARRDAAMGAPYRLFYRRPVHLVRGYEATLVDADGVEYLDAYNNVPVVGHANARVREAVDRQLGLLNTHTRYLTDLVVEYAERLTALFPPPLDQAIFTCTGSEAVDLALRIARAVTGQHGVIVTRHAYHGTTSATAEVSPGLGPGNAIPPWVAFVDAPDLVRHPERDLLEFGRLIDQAVDALRARGFGVAAVLLDSVFSSDGLHPDPVGLLAVAAERTRAAGGLFIADEVQAGFGRTGAWWGFGRHGVVPDLVALGKPMGNGMPIGGVVGSAAHFATFGELMRYFNTFGGNPVSAAAAIAVLDEIEERGLLTHARVVGADLLDSLTSAVLEDAGVAQVRSVGLFLAVELVDGNGAPDPGRAGEVVNALRDRRILISASGSHGHVLKIRPPLVFPAAAVDRLAGALGEALAVPSTNSET